MQGKVHMNEGVGLFNIGRYWDAHECWEACWRGSHEPDATFYKGIIQVAAALVHWQRGNPRGLSRNWYKARPKLVALAPAMHQLDLARLIAEMDAFVLTGSLHAPPRLHAAVDTSCGNKTVVY